MALSDLPAARSSAPRVAGPSSASPDLRHFAELERGGHFAAIEQPTSFVAELRAAFATMR